MEWVWFALFVATLVGHFMGWMMGYRYGWHDSFLHHMDKYSKAPAKKAPKRTTRKRAPK